VKLISGGTPSGARGYNGASLLRVENGSGDNYLEFRNRADTGTYGGILFTDNNVGGYIAFRTYVGGGANDGTNGDYMVYGTYTDHIFQNGGSETVNGKTETFRIYANGNIRATGTVYAGGTSYYINNSTSYLNNLELAGVFKMGSYGIRNFTLGFGNTSNQKANLEFDPGFWGWIEVEGTTSYNYANRPGRLAKRYYLGLNPGNAQYVNETRVVDVGGNTRYGIAFSDIIWTGSRYRIVIANRDNAANSYRIKVTVFAEGEGGRNIVTDSMTLSGVYTSDGTVYPDSYIYFNDNIGFGTSQPGYGIHVNRNLNQVAAFQSPNANTWVDIISTARTWSLGSAASTSFTIYDRGSNTTRFELTTGSDLYIGRDYYGYRFYDRDNTAYYADPQGTSQFNVLQVAGYVRQQNDGGTFLASDVSEANNWIFQENARGWGEFYFNKGSQSGQTFGNYSTVGAETFFIGQGTGTTMPAWTGYNSGSRVAIMLSNYTGYIWANNYIYSAAGMDAPIFRDANNTAFYIDPANGGFNMQGGSSNRVTFYCDDSGIHVSNSEGNGQGEVRLGAAWGRPGIYSPNYLSLGTGGSYIEFVTGNVQRGYVNSSSEMYMPANVRSRIFYDYDDSGYNIQPNDLSTLYNLRLGGAYSVNTSTGARLHAMFTSDGKYMTRNSFGTDGSMHGIGNWTNVSDGPAGAYTFRGPSAWEGLVESGRIPIDTARSYKVSCWMRTVSGNPFCYLSYRQSTWNFGDHGNGGWGNPYWFVGVPSSSWTYYSMTVGPSGCDYGHWGGPTKWAQVGWLHNYLYSGYSGQAEITGFKIEEMDDTLAYNCTTRGNHYADAYYDRNNGGYYVNPDDYSNMNYVNLASVLRFNGNDSRRLIGENVNGYNTLSMYGNWDTFQVMGRVIDWSTSNMHFGNGYNGVGHSPYYWVLGNPVAYAQINGPLYVTGDVVAYYSDRRLKQNIEPIPNALDIIAGIGAYTFEWNKLSEEKWAKREGDKDFGLISQEVEAVWPMGVVLQGAKDINDKQGYSDPDSEFYDPLHKETNKEDYKTVRYDKMVTLAIAAIKELKVELDDARAEIKELREELSKK